MLLQGFPLLGVDLEDAVPVAIERERDALAPEDLLQHQEVSLSVLLFPKQGEGDGPRGVVDGSYQGQGGPTPFQPIVTAAVHLEEHPLLRVTLPPDAVLGRPAPTGTSDPRCCQDAPHRGVGQHQPFVLCQEIRQVAVVHPLEAPLGQLPHPCPGFLPQGMGRLSSPVPVSYGSRSLLSVGCQQSPPVALTHPQEPGGLPHPQMPSQDPVQHL